MSIVIAKHTNWTTNQKIIIILRIIWAIFVIYLTFYYIFLII